MESRVCAPAGYCGTCTLISKMYFSQWPNSVPAERHIPAKAALHAGFGFGLTRPVACSANSARLHRVLRALNSDCLEGGSEMLRMARIRSTRIGTLLVLSLGLALLSGCAALGGGNSNGQPSTAVAVTPATGKVRAG